MLLFSSILSYYAINYATEEAGVAVNDLLLNNLPVVNVDFIVNEGMLIFGTFVFFLTVIEPKRIPFSLKSIALFYIVRSIFVIMTHLGPVPYRSYLDPQDLLYKLNAGGDYFFSGHTGLPFLIALIFWRKKRIRMICIASAVFFGASVILGHLHYSIDVFSAFFIAFGIYHIARNVFVSDYKIFIGEKSLAASSE